MLAAPSHTCLTPQPQQAFLRFGWYSVRLPAKGWPGWVDLTHDRARKANQSLAALLRVRMIADQTLKIRESLLQPVCRWSRCCPLVSRTNPLMRSPVTPWRHRRYRPMLFNFKAKRQVTLVRRGHSCILFFFIFFITQTLFDVGYQRIVRNLYTCIDLA